MERENNEREREWNGCERITSSYPEFFFSDQTNQSPGHSPVSDSEPITAQEAFTINKILCDVWWHVWTKQKGCDVTPIPSAARDMVHTLCRFKHRADHRDLTSLYLSEFVLSKKLRLAVNRSTVTQGDKVGLRCWRDSLTRWETSLSSTVSFTSSNLSVSLLSSHLIALAVSPFSWDALRRDAELPEAESQSDREVFTDPNKLQGWFTWANHVHQSVQASDSVLFRSFSLPLTLPIPV